jgi:hypothetical protein
VWLLFAVVAVLLGAAGYHFSVRTLRWVTFVVALAIVVYLPLYGLTHPARDTGNLSGAFARGADTLSGALIRPLAGGHQVPVPGRIGWLIIVVLLVLGYRILEAWALRRQAPCLDMSALTSDRQDDSAVTATDAKTGEQLHERLVAELKFRLPTVEVRSPSILPGGSRSSGLASIAEATGVTGAGLAGAVIRFFGMVWPNPPQVQVRVWVERLPRHAPIDGPIRVTVGLADPRTGASIATKTLAAAGLDDAADAVAGYVARHIFARDGTVPPQRRPRRLGQADRDPGRRRARQPVRRRRPVRTGAALRTQQQQAQAGRRAAAARRQPGAVSTLLPWPLPPGHLAGDARESALQARRDRHDHAEGSAAHPGPVRCHQWRRRQDRERRS